MCVNVWKELARFKSPSTDNTVEGYKFFLRYAVFSSVSGWWQRVNVCTMDTDGRLGGLSYIAKIIPLKGVNVR